MMGWGLKIYLAGIGASYHGWWTMEAGMSGLHAAEKDICIFTEEPCYKGLLLNYFGRSSC